jgi:Mg-chelatase subunit ChlD
LQAARHVAETIRSHGWRTVVLDTEAGRAGTGFARALSGWLGAEYMRLDTGSLQQRHEAAD